MILGQQNESLIEMYDSVACSHDTSHVYLWFKSCLGEMRQHEFNRSPQWIYTRGAIHVSFFLKPKILNKTISHISPYRW